MGAPDDPSTPVMQEKTSQNCQSPKNLTDLLEQEKRHSARKMVTKSCENSIVGFYTFFRLLYLWPSPFEPTCQRSKWWHFKYQQKKNSNEKLPRPSKSISWEDGQSKNSNPPAVRVENESDLLLLICQFLALWTIRGHSQTKLGISIFFRFF